MRLIWISIYRRRLIRCVLTTLDEKKIEDTKKVNRELIISLVSLGFASAAPLFYSPLSYLSVPGIFFLASRFYKELYFSFKEREGIGLAQVHAYICYLRRLPYEEQLYWPSFNERPKTGISKRAFTHDFKGEWATFMNPLQKVLSVIRHWHNEQISWWVLREESLLGRVNMPLTESRDEWAEALMDLVGSGRIQNKTHSCKT